MKDSRLFIVVVLSTVAIAFLSCSKQPTGENRTVNQGTKNHRYSEDELRKTASPLDLMKSEHWDERFRGYKRLRQEVDIAGQPEIVDEVFKAIRAEKDVRCFPYVFWPLQSQLSHKGKFGDDIMTRLFVLLDEERTEVWYGAAVALQDLHTRWKHPNIFRERKESLTGKARLRLETAGSYSPEYHEELQTMGDGASPFLASCATFEVYLRSPALFARACDMLAFLNDDNAVEVLISALEELYANGKCDTHVTTDLAPGQALRAINKLTGQNYAGFGHNFGAMSTDSVGKVDWRAVIDKLRADFAK